MLLQGRNEGCEIGETFWWFIDFVSAYGLFYKYCSCEAVSHLKNIVEWSSIKVLNKGMVIHHIFRGLDSLTIDQVFRYCFMSYNVIRF